MTKIINEMWLFTGVFAGISALLTVLDVADNKTWLSLPFVLMTCFCFRVYMILRSDNVEK